MSSEPFSTIGGVPTRDEAYRKLMHHLDECITQCQLIGHLHKTEAGKLDDLFAKGWYGCAEMFTMTKEQIRQLAMKRLV
jgi:hypothetical protein